MTRLKLKRFQQHQLSIRLKERHGPGEGSRVFWSKTERHFRSVSASLRGFTQPNSETIPDPQKMADIAAKYYESLFVAPTVARPHPCADAPYAPWDNHSDPISRVTYLEVLSVLRSRKKNHSLDFHGLSPFILEKYREITGIS